MLVRRMLNGRVPQWLVWRALPRLIGESTTYRIVPMGITYLRDPHEAAAEIRAALDRGPGRGGGVAAV